MQSADEEHKSDGADVGKFLRYAKRYNDALQGYSTG